MTNHMGPAYAQDNMDWIWTEVRAKIVEMVREEFKEELQEQRTRIRRLERELFGVPGASGG